MTRYSQTPRELEAALLVKMKRDYAVKRADLEPHIEAIAREMCGCADTWEASIDEAIEALKQVATAINTNQKVDAKAISRSHRLSLI